MIKDAGHYKSYLGSYYEEVITATSKVISAQSHGSHTKYDLSHLTTE